MDSLKREQRSVAAKAEAKGKLMTRHGFSEAYTADYDNEDGENQLDTEKYEGKFARNNDWIAFVNEGKWYVGPDSEEAAKLLNDSGFLEDETDMSVPHSNPHLR